MAAIYAPNPGKYSQISQGTALLVETIGIMIARIFIPKLNK
jgi:hypothetical protein